MKAILSVGNKFFTPALDKSWYFEVDQSLSFGLDEYPPIYAIVRGGSFSKGTDILKD